MTERNYWQRMRRSRMSRRALLRASGRAGVGAAGLALVGCGDDDDDDSVAQVQQQQQQDQPAAQVQQEQQQQQQAMQQQQEQQQQQAVAQAEQAEQQEQQAMQQQQQQQEEPVDLSREGDTDWERTVVAAVPNAVGGLDVQAPGNYTLKWNGPLHFDRLLQYDLVTREIVPHVGSFEWVDDFHLVGLAYQSGTRLARRHAADGR